MFSEGDDISYILIPHKDINFYTVNKRFEHEYYLYCTM